MALSPLDIHNKEFGRSWQGYDKDEVNEFLEQVYNDYENVLKENKELKKKVAEKEEQVSYFNNIETTLQKSILIAQEAAEDVRRNSMKESTLIVKEAEKNADRIVNEALSRARKISTEIEDLKKQSKIFRGRFKILIEAQLELIESSDWDNLLEYEIDAETQNLVAERQELKEEE